MRKPTVNFLIDTASFVAFTFLISTGLLIYLKLPPGHGHLEIWGLNRHGWGDVHFWISMTFIVLMLVHLYLHWEWIICMIKGKVRSALENRKHLIIAFIFLMIVLGVAVSPFFSEIVNTKV